MPTQLAETGAQFPHAIVTTRGVSRGVSKTNQDAAILYEARSHTILGVLDGHGPSGHVSSVLGVDALLSAFDEPDYAGGGSSWPDKQWRSVMADVAKRAEQAVVASTPDKYSGSTLSLAALVGGVSPRCVVCNAGDSRVVIGRRRKRGHCGSIAASADGGTSITGSVVYASKDHTCDLPSERKRIEMAGGQVAFDRDGPPRVVVSGTRRPGLAMSRSLGDSLAKSIGVTADPDIDVVDLPLRLPDGDEKCDNIADAGELEYVVIVASDGLWEYIGSEDAVTIAFRAVDATDRSPDAGGGASLCVDAECSGGGTTPGGSAACMRSARALLRASTRQWMRFQTGGDMDDITISVATPEYPTRSCAEKL